VTTLNKEEFQTFAGKAKKKKEGERVYITKHKKELRKSPMDLGRVLY